VRRIRANGAEIIAHAQAATSVEAIAEVMANHGFPEWVAKRLMATLGKPS
jgi:hypothetical protein